MEKKKQYNVIVCACACGCYRHVRVSTISSPFNTPVVGECERLGVGCSVGGIGDAKKKKEMKKRTGRRRGQTPTVPPRPVYTLPFTWHWKSGQPSMTDQTAGRHLSIRKTTRVQTTRWIECFGQSTGANYKRTQTTF